MGGFPDLSKLSVEVSSVVATGVALAARVPHQRQSFSTRQRMKSVAK
ncbi:hypothetical protein H6G27_09135 [Nostoc linckia FACHB-104]|nr:hypothetical protein [Nostoc linckia FACHB-104]